MLSCISTECSAEHMTRIQNEIQKNGGSYKNIKIKSKTLNDIFEENFLEHINYMSIDTEGAELTVLKSLNFKKYKVDVISIECNSNFAASYLMNNGYDYISTVCGDAIFKLK
jgi:FkbM family methyltransferase